MQQKINAKQMDSGLITDAELYLQYKKYNSQYACLDNDISQENFRQEFMGEMKAEREFLFICREELKKYFQEEYTREERNELSQQVKMI